MKISISVVRPFHASLMANTLHRSGHLVSIVSSAPRRFFRGLDSQVAVRLVPAPITIFSQIFHCKVPQSCWDLETAGWDLLAAAVSQPAEVFIGFATQSLASGKAAHRRGETYVLDRACPYVDFQQNLSLEESSRLGARFKPQPEWFRQRQLAEYELADLIVTPSQYTARSFPRNLQRKLIVAPLLGRTLAPERVAPQRHDIFTVGVVGGMPLRKGYLYLLLAWKKLALPNATLRIRSSGDFTVYPVLHALLKELPNVELLGYIPNMAEFYASCDVFVLPSVDDGFGMALLEAMVNGVPTISTRNCGASELVTDGVDGLVIDARNVDQLQQAILKLYEEEELRQSIGAAGRATASRISSTSLYQNALLAGLSTLDGR